MLESSANPHSYSLATCEERESILARQHHFFREIDAAFHQYLETVTSHPQWEDAQIDQELIDNGVEADLAAECVTFGPMAWGREIAEQMGVVCSPLIRIHSLIDDSEYETMLQNEPTYAWARAMIALYRLPERTAVFRLVAFRSAEVHAISNALYAAPSPSDLRGSIMQPTLVYLRRTADSDL